MRGSKRPREPARRKTSAANACPRNCVLRPQQVQAMQDPRQTASVLLAHLREQHAPDVRRGDFDRFVGNIGGAFCHRCRLPFTRAGMRKHVESCAAVDNEEAQPAAPPSPALPAAEGSSPRAEDAVSEPGPPEGHDGEHGRPPKAARAAPAEGAEPAAVPPPRAFPSVLDIAAHGPIRRDVPPGVKALWQAYLGDALLRFTAARNDDEREWAIVRLLQTPLMLTECRGGRGGAKARTMSRRLARALANHDGEAQVLYDEAKHAVPEARVVSREERLVRRALQLAKLGQPAKALRALSSTMRVASLTPAVRERLLELHPQRDEALDGVCVPDPASVIVFNPEDEGLRAEVRAQLSKGAAPGPSGMCEAHLHVAVEDDVLYAALLRVLDWIVQGRAGPRVTALLLSSTLVALQPSSDPEDGPPSKVRPIAMGEVLTRLAGELALYVLGPAIAPIFGNVQLGVRAPGGSQAAATAHLHGHRNGYPVILSDLRNAFNELSRRRGLEALAAQPGLVRLRPLARWLLATPSALLVDGEVVCTSRTGVRQGDPLSPLVFALGIHAELLEAVRVAPGAITCAVLDNVTHVGPPEEAARAALRFRELITARGDLRFKPSGGAVVLPAQQWRDAWSPQARAALQQYREVADAPLKEADVVLGVPVGDDEFVLSTCAELLKQRHGEAISLMVRADSSLPCQLSLVLLRYLLNGAAMHMLRAVPPHLSQRLAIMVDNFAQRFVVQRVLTQHVAERFRRASERAVQQARLPCSAGGLGLPRAAEVAPIAFYAGLAQTAALGLLRHVAAAPHSEWTQECLDDVLATEPLALARNRDATQVLVPDVGTSVAVFAQRFAPVDAAPRPQAPFAGREGPAGGQRGRADGRRERPQPTASKVQRRLWQPWKAELEQRFRQQHRTVPQLLQRLDSARGRVAAGYLTCLPRGSATTVSDADFCIATRLRLGVPVALGLPEECVCGELLSDCYTHLLACQTLMGQAPAQHEGGLPGTRNWWDVRHRLMLERLTADLVAGGAGAVLEPGALDPRPDAEDRRPDQLITYTAVNQRDGMLKRVTTDLTVAETVTRAVCGRSSAAAHLDLKMREKRREYDEPMRAAGCVFTPLVFASLGLMHEQTETFLKLEDMNLDERRLQRLGSGRRQFVARLFDGLSCALVRGNARMLFYACAELVRLRWRAERAAPPG